MTFGNLYSTPFTSITTIGGNVSLTQGGGTNDQVNSAVCFANFSGAFSFDWPTTIGGNLSITQGNGNTDIVLLNVDTVAGNASVVQGGGTQDQVSFSVNGGGFNGCDFTLATSIGGNLSVTQGNGASDQLNLGVNFASLDNSSFSDPVAIRRQCVRNSGNRNAGPGELWRE